MKRIFNQRENFNDLITNAKSQFDFRGRLTYSIKNANINIRSYSKEQLDELYQKKVIEVKNKYQKVLKKKPCQVASKICKELKRCEKCSDFINQNSMMLCTYCEDAYHCYCVDFSGRSKKRDEYVCPNCEIQLENEETIPTRLKGFNKTVKKIQKVKFINVNRNVILAKNLFLKHLNINQ